MRSLNGPLPEFVQTISCALVLEMNPHASEDCEPFRKMNGFIQLSENQHSKMQFSFAKCSDNVYFLEGKQELKEEQTVSSYKTK